MPQQFAFKRRFKSVSTSKATKTLSYSVSISQYRVKFNAFWYRSQGLYSPKEINMLSNGDRFILLLFCRHCFRPTKHTMNKFINSITSRTLLSRRHIQRNVWLINQTYNDCSDCWVFPPSQSQFSVFLIP